MGLGDGSLPLASFKSYLVQDYLYLVRQPREDIPRMHPLSNSPYLLQKIHFARANALAGYKAANMQDISAVRATDSNP